MNIMILDTETTGLPIKWINGEEMNYNEKFVELYNSARMIEIGYIVYSLEGTELFRRNFLIKPDNFIITNQEIHGITNEIVKKDGFPIVDILEILEVDLIGVDTLVAHNIMFDFNVLMAECVRYNRLTLVDTLKTLKQECTMKIGQKFLNQKKYPKLQELYSALNTDNLVQPHRALDDSIMCANCYFKMKRK